MTNETNDPSSHSKDTEQAMLGAGCFWGVQYYLDQAPGVTTTTVGYSGGHTENPSYEDVCTHTTGHAEVVLVTFDPQQVSYQTLVRHFFRMHNPTELNRQGPDIGDNYRSVIYYFNDQQKLTAEQVRDESQPLYKQPIVTEISAAEPYYEAEDYHQKYAERTGRGLCHVPYQPIDT